MALPIGQKGIDYPNGGFSSGSNLYPSVGDVGELAVRMGGIPSIDRRGNVVIAEDFRYGTSILETVTAGLGEEIESSSLYSRFGGYTVRMTRIASASSYAKIRNRVAAKASSGAGGEVLFVVMTNRCEVWLDMGRHTGDEYMYGVLRWDGPNENVYIGSVPQGWTLAKSGVKMNYGYPLLHSMKLIIDEANEAYVRAIIDGEDIPLPDVSLRVVTDTAAPDSLLVFDNAIGPLTISSVYVDAMIITSNE